MSDSIMHEIRRLAALAGEMQKQTAEAVGLLRDFRVVAELLAAANGRLLAENAKLLVEVERLRKVIAIQAGVRA